MVEVVEVFDLVKLVEPGEVALDEVEVEVRVWGLKGAGDGTEVEDLVDC